DNQQQELVTEVRNAGGRATSLARKLLAFGRHQVEQPQVVDINSVVADMEQLLRVMVQDRIELTITPKATASSIFCGPGEIEQVITTLVLNAHDAMPDGGKLTIETADGQDNFIKLAVTDTGSGMDPETQTHLFEPFFTTKPKGTGAGLGLSTIYKM